MVGLENRAQVWQAAAMASWDWSPKAANLRAMFGFEVVARHTRC